MKERLTENPNKKVKKPSSTFSKFALERLRGGVVNLKY